MGVLAFVAASLGRTEEAGRVGRRQCAAEPVGVPAVPQRGAVPAATNVRGRHAQDPPLLAPCYDLATTAPFLFSHANTVNSE